MLNPESLIKQSNVTTTVRPPFVADDSKYLIVPLVVIALVMILTLLVFVPPRVTVTTKDATTVAPLMVTTRQPKELLSWKLPLSVETETGEEVYKNSSRTLCFDILNHNKIQGFKQLQHENPIVSLATSSLTSIDFTVTVDFPNEFLLEHSTNYSIQISPSEPHTEVRESNYDTVILEVLSLDTICTIVSIQNVSCPVFDLNQDITFRGFYETFTTKGGITIPVSI
ncbi:hypothetical protein HUJ05_006348 [Dendroctonus ponderosae]|nr:hypothetical protein HUJ05_006348 [Dendroctonus ponderosae]